MQNRVLYRNPFFFMFIILISLVCNNGDLLAGQDDATIDKVRLDFNRAYNENNAQALAQVFDSEAVLMPPGEATIVGRDKIEARYKGFFAKVKAKFELEAGDIQSCGNWAYVNGKWNRVDTPAAGGAAKSVSGRYLLIMKKQSDGSWKVARDIWNESARP